MPPKKNSSNDGEITTQSLEELLRNHLDGTPKPDGGDDVVWERVKKDVFDEHVRYKPPGDLKEEEVVLWRQDFLVRCTDTLMAKFAGSALSMVEPPRDMVVMEPVMFMDPRLLQMMQMPHVQQQLLAQRESDEREQLFQQITARNIALENLPLNGLIRLCKSLHQDRLNGLVGFMKMIESDPTDSAAYANLIEFHNHKLTPCYQAFVKRDIWKKYTAERPEIQLIKKEFSQLMLRSYLLQCQSVNTGYVSQSFREIKDGFVQGVYELFDIVSQFKKDCPYYDDIGELHRASMAIYRKQLLEILSECKKAISSKLSPELRAGVIEVKEEYAASLDEEIACCKQSDDQEVGRYTKLQEIRILETQKRYSRVIDKYKAIITELSDRELSTLSKDESILLCTALVSKNIIIITQLAEACGREIGEKGRVDGLKIRAEKDIKEIIDSLDKVKVVFKHVSNFSIYGFEMHDPASAVLKLAKELFVVCGFFEEQDEKYYLAQKRNALKKIYEMALDPDFRLQLYCFNDNFYYPAVMEIKTDLLGVERVFRSIIQKEIEQGKKAAANQALLDRVFAGKEARANQNADELFASLQKEEESKKKATLKLLQVKKGTLEKPKEVVVEPVEKVVPEKGGVSKKKKKKGKSKTEKFNQSFSEAIESHCQWLVYKSTDTYEDVLNKYARALEATGDVDKRCQVACEQASVVKDQLLAVVKGSEECEDPKALYDQFVGYIQTARGYLEVLPKKGPVRDELCKSVFMIEEDGKGTIDKYWALVVRAEEKLEALEIERSRAKESMQARGNTWNRGKAFKDLPASSKARVERRTKLQDVVRNKEVVEKLYARQHSEQVPEQCILHNGGSGKVIPPADLAHFLTV